MERGALKTDLTLCRWQAVCFLINSVEAGQWAECGHIQDTTQNAWRPCFSVLVLSAQCRQAPLSGPLPLLAARDEAGLGSEPANLLPARGRGLATRNTTQSSGGFSSVLSPIKMPSKPVPDR